MDSELVKAHFGLEKDHSGLQSVHFWFLKEVLCVLNGEFASQKPADGRLFPAIEAL
jgi:hypothetical protein